MDPLSHHFTPPLMLTVPTGEITFRYVGVNVERQPSENVQPLRSAKEGHMSIYGDYQDAGYRIVIAVSFEETDLPALNRQAYYHYLDREDICTMSEDNIEFIFNNLPTTPRSANEEYQNAISWHIKLTPGVFDTVGTMLTRLRATSLNIPPFASLSAEERSVIHFNLRSTVIEQPIPERLGALGHWQHRFPAGTPLSLPFMGGRYRARAFGMPRLTVQEEMNREERLRDAAVAARNLRDIQSGRAVSPTRVAPWLDENEVSGSESSLPELTAIANSPVLSSSPRVYQDAYKIEVSAAAAGKQRVPLRQTGSLLSPPFSNEYSPKGKQALSGKHQANNIAPRFRGFNASGGFEKLAEIYAAI